jgi:hypothetical protein
MCTTLATASTMHIKIKFGNIREVLFVLHVTIVIATAVIVAVVLLLQVFFSFLLLSQW